MAIEYWQPSEPQRVLKTRLRLIELLDDLKLEGCWAQTRVRVIPIFLDTFVPPEIPEIARAVPGGDRLSAPEAPVLARRATGGVGGIGDGGLIDLPPTKPTPYPHLAVVLSASAVTDGEGYADFTVLLADAMAQVMAITRADGSLPVGLCFDQAFSANAYGVQLPWTSPLGVELIKFEGKDPFLIVDLAKTIVGDTSATHATLWFQLHGEPRAGDRYVCDIVDINPPGGSLIGGTHLDPSMSGGVILPQPAAPPSDHITPGELSAGEHVDGDSDLGLSPLRQRVYLRADRAMTGVATFRNLRPGALYGYLFKVRLPAGEERLLTQGRFRTFDADPKRMNIAFGSCHMPSDEQSLNRWEVLARRTDQDALFLIGDQIYADNIEKMFPDTNAIQNDGERWLVQYTHRYNQLFAYQPMRDVMRTRPTYMICDDHEILDDWGTDNIGDTRVQAGIKAYRIFQQSHNPGGFDAPLFDYTFRRGRAAFCFVDNRSSRKFGAEYPVLGQARIERLRAWAKSAEVQDADLVFVMVPVPPGILPIEAIQEWASRFAHSIGVAVGAATGAGAGALAGAILGGIGGFLVGGPAGAAAGAALGAQIGGAVGFVAGGAGAAYAYEWAEDNIQDPDFRDAWTYDKNVRDLERLLDVLFDVANDVQPNGGAGPKPKGVFVLSGDYHYGTMHRLRSRRDRRRHGVNPTMMQITSSPISKRAENGTGMNFIIDTFASGTFRLDPARNYESQYLDRTMERNFGRVVYEHVGPGRRYHIQLYVEGETKTLVRMFELDLDKRPVVMRDMIGDILATRGRISLLRVHDPNTGYGPSGDRIDGEVVIHLDTAPGRAFGFQLRNGSSLAVRRAMLDLLSDAFNNNHTVEIDYRRTGPANGTIIRANVISR